MRNFKCEKLLNKSKMGTNIQGPRRLTILVIYPKGRDGPPVFAYLFGDRHKIDPQTCTGINIEQWLQIQATALSHNQRNATLFVEAAPYETPLEPRLHDTRLQHKGKKHYSYLRRVINAQIDMDVRNTDYRRTGLFHQFLHMFRYNTFPQREGFFLRRIEGAQTFDLQKYLDRFGPHHTYLFVKRILDLGLKELDVLGTDLRQGGIELSRFYKSQCETIKLLNFAPQTGRKIDCNNKQSYVWTSYNARLHIVQQAPPRFRRVYNRIYRTALTNVKDMMDALDDFLNGRVYENTGERVTSEDVTERMLYVGVCLTDVYTMADMMTCIEDKGGFVFAYFGDFHTSAYVDLLKDVYMCDVVYHDAETDDRPRQCLLNVPDPLTLEVEHAAVSEPSLKKRRVVRV